MNLRRPDPATREADGPPGASPLPSRRAGTAARRRSPASATGPRPYRVAGRRTGRPGEVRLRLVPAEPGTPVPRSRPGQYWVLHTSAGAGIPAVDVTPAGGTVLELTTLWVPCGPPIAPPGDVITARGPFGTGWDMDVVTGRDLLVIAWENGLTLTEPVMERAAAGGGRVRLWLGGRVPPATGADRRAVPEGVALMASDLPGMVEAARTADFTPLGGAAVLAGPLPMARAAAATLVARGMPAGAIQLAAHALLRCGTSACGRCRIGTPHGPLRACHDGPVLRYDRIAHSPPPGRRASAG